MPSIICGKCHDINEANATSCQRCGARFCPNCHLVIDSPSASVCPHCGKKDHSFRPGKYAATTMAAASAPSSEIMPGKTVCASCGNRIDSGARKCPYCGQLGQRQSLAPAQGMQSYVPPATGQAPYSRPERQAEDTPARQLHCQKCGSAIPPGSSMCPKHGKYGILVEGEVPLPGRYTGDLWGKVMERRAASAEAGQARLRSQTNPQDIFPQVAAGQPPVPDMQAAPPQTEQRACPQCGAPVPDRSKICPNCGWNRLPREGAKPIPRAEDFYKAREGAAAGGQPYASYMPDQQPYYGQPAVQPYYGQPAVQPYEMVYQPPPPPLDVGIPYPEDRKRKKEKKPREREDYRSAPRARQSLLPLLLALIAIGAVIVLGIMFILDQMKAPAGPVVPPPTTPPTSSGKAPVISNISYKDITRTSAVVAWKTDKKSNSIVVYCLDGGDQCENARDDTLVTDHSVKLTKLEPDKAYHITVKSRLDDDPNSPDATLEHTQVLRTLGTPDTVPPKITEVKPTNITSSSASITWKTDEPSTSQVSYGPTSSLGTLQPTSSDTNMTVVHDINLYGLPPQMTIHFKVISRDADGNTASSPVATFLTLPPAGTAIGNAAADFSLKAADGSTVTLGSLQGSKVILNFWALNCAPCLGEMPHFQQLHTSKPNLPVLLVAGPQLGPVNPNAIGSFLQNNGYDFTVLLDETGQVGSLYSISSVPRTFFIDSGGIIRKIKDGAFASLSEIENMLNY